MKSVRASTLIGIALASSPVGATTIHVPSDKPTIQAGVDGASPGDTVLVAIGTFTGGGNRNIDFGGKDVVLRSEDGPGATTIDCQFGGHGFIFQSGESSAAVVDGFTIRRGSHNSGGGMLLSNSSPTVVNCIFTGNVAGYGGAVYCSSSAATFVDCSFSANYIADFGGTGGAAAACSGSSPTLFIRCTFSGNNGFTYGGAIWSGCSGLSPMFEDCMFVENTAAAGGAVYCHRGSPRFADCIFYDNSADFGGAVYAYDLSRPVLEGCTLFGNRASQSGRGGGIYSSAELINTIIAFSTVGEAVACGNRSVELTCCDLYGNAGGDWVGCIADQLGTNGNISADPLFCDSGNDDFTLAVNSPCAPGNSPPGCGLIGAEPVGCGVAAIAAGGAPPGRFGIRVLPQPFTSQGVLEWTNELSGTVVIKLYDPQGRLVLIRDIGNRGSGLQRIHQRDVWGDRALAAGVYFLELTGSSEKRELARLVILP